MSGLVSALLLVGGCGHAPVVPPAPVCGDGVCADGENTNSCVADCAPRQPAQATLTCTGDRITSVKLRNIWYMRGEEPFTGIAPHGGRCFVLVGTPRRGESMSQRRDVDFKSVQSLGVPTDGRCACRDGTYDLVEGYFK